MKIFKAIDWLVRVQAMLVIILTAFPLLVFTCIMLTDTGTLESISLSIFIFLIGSAFLVSIFLCALKLNKLESGWADHALLVGLLFRVPVYLFGTIGFSLLLNQYGIVNFNG